MKNKYFIDNINGVVTIELNKRENKIFYTTIDLNDLDRINKYNGKFYVVYREDSHDHYCRITLYLGTHNGKSKNKVLYLHQIIIGIAGKGKTIDHINHTGLDNRKENLIIVKRSRNSQNRKGANRNNNTGFRNVSFIKEIKKYWVQIMKNGIRYKWDFDENQLEDAIKFSETKRKELFDVQ